MLISKMVRILKNEIKAASNIRSLTRVRLSEKFAQERLKSEIQRTVHQIEKGLCINEPKKGFGLEKIDKLVCYLKALRVCDEESKQVLDRGCNCIKTYFEFFEQKGWADNKVLELKQKFNKEKFSFTEDSSFGGVISMKKEMHSREDFDILDKIATSRHSVRNFTNESVNIADIFRAVDFAQKAPSACNRQATRCYIINHDMFEKCQDWLAGIGFFGEYGFDKILLITAKTTGYNENEDIEHLVSPGIFVGYLVLALEALNVGACIMQRSLYDNKNWKNFRHLMDIPADEQSFCLIGVGMKKDFYKVPASKRLSTDIIAKEIK